jgi:branched-chain amino acid transport system permease protein
MGVALQALVNCLLLGGLYTLIAIGLSLVFSVMRIINFAHGQMYMLGAYVVFFVYGSAHLPFVLALVLAAISVGAFGALTELAIIRPVQSDESRAMVATLGALIALQGAAVVLFGETNKFADEPISGTISLGPALISGYKLAAAVTALVLVAALFAALRWTRLGQALRSLAQAPEAAILLGVRVNRLRAIGFAIGAGLAAVAGGLIMPLNSVSPEIGEPIILKMFIILILGGLGSVSGALVGAFVLAAIETFGVTYVGELSILFVYVLVMAVIMIKPEGLLAKGGRQSA